MIVRLLAAGIVLALASPALAQGNAAPPIVTGLFVSALATPEYLIEIEAVAAIS